MKLLLEEFKQENDWIDIFVTLSSLGILATIYVKTMLSIIGV